MTPTHLEPLAVVDVDGVMYDFVRYLGVTAAQHYGRPLSDFPPAQVWNFFKDQWSLTLQEYLDLVDVGVEKYDLIRCGDPFPDSIEGIELLLATGVNVHIATNLGSDGDPKGHRAARLAWLTDHGVDLSSVEVTFTADKVSVARPALDAGAMVFGLEDNVDNFRALTEAGVACFFMDQAWNRSESDSPRVALVLEFATRVAELLPVYL